MVEVSIFMFVFIKHTCLDWRKGLTLHYKARLTISSISTDDLQYSVDINGFLKCSHLTTVSH